MNNGFNTTYTHNWQTMDFATTSYKVNVNVKIETIGGRVEDFSIEPNEKLTIEADDRALFLVSKEKRIPIAPLEHYIYVTNNLNDYVIQNSGELSITPNGIEYIEKYSGGWRKRVIATPTQMLGLYGNDFCRMTGDYGRYFMQKDKIDGMVHKANELKSSPDPMQRAIGQELVKILKDYGLVN